ncbi:MAG: hypothetical protein J6V20_05815 [Bacteroidaceae bacterium]|nr:hypothetical protein [Bacteroidaceae bacterium]
MACVQSIALLSQGTIPNLQCNINVTPLAFNVVGVECFGISSFEDAAFAACFAIVQALPCLKHISTSFFFG